MIHLDYKSPILTVVVDRPRWYVVVDISRSDVLRLSVTKNPDAPTVHLFANRIEALRWALGQAEKHAREGLAVNLYASSEGY